MKKTRILQAREEVAQSKNDKEANRDQLAAHDLKVMSGTVAW